jgi:hypothetical protein
VPAARATRPWSDVRVGGVPSGRGGDVERMFASTVTPPETFRAMAIDRDTPEFLLDATRFQTHAHIFNPLWVIKTLRKYEGAPHFLIEPLYMAVAKAGEERGSSFGRPRGAGRFELAYLAFVFSRHPDVKPWWQSAGHSIWRASGFQQRPSYALCHRRFAELEHPKIIEAMEEVAGTLIKLAVKGSDGRVGRFLHVDSTEAETHARLEHVCPEWKPCWKTKAPGSWRGGGRVSAAAGTPTVRAERHIRSADPEPEPAEVGEDTDIGDAETIERRPGRLRVKVGGCWYEVLDPTAGIRAYVTRGVLKRFWVGFYNAKAIDHFVGAPVAVRITSASTQEYYTYPDLFRSAYENTGQLPRAVVADRGYSVSYVFQHNTQLGVGSVMPWRAGKNRLTRDLEDCDTHDRHGVVRCKHCGAPTRFVSFTRTAGEKRDGSKRGPRLYAQCLTPVTPGCEARQSIGCDQSWRMLLPLWRDSPTYLALRHSHDRYERVHHHWRVRWRSGSDDHSLRPKRRGRDNQQLRANAALMIEWLMICWREHWLPDSRPLGKPDHERIKTDAGSDRVESLNVLRSDLGLDRPFGTKAKALKIGELKPVAKPAAEREEDPTEPEAPVPVGAERLLDDLDEAQPAVDPLENAAGDAAEVLLDDLPF